MPIATRTEMTPDDIQAVANELQRSAATLMATAEVMRELGKDSIAVSQRPQRAVRDVVRSVADITEALYEQR